MYDEVQGLTYVAEYLHGSGAAICMDCVGKKFPNLCTKLPLCSPNDVIFIIKEY